MRELFLLLGSLAILPSDLLAACVAQSGAQRPHLVELYTAEGCASCPPAERWMSSLRTSKDYVGLEFHVDYFDAQGWRDPFADPRYTARQKLLVKHSAKTTHFNTQAGIVYTPQVIVDGHVWTNWPKAAPPAFGTADPLPISLDVALGTTILAKVASPSGTSLPSSYQVDVALSENGLSSSVKAGENRGKRLDHDLVVRDFAGPLTPAQAETGAELKLPAGFDPAKSAVVAFVEDAKNSEIVQVLRLPLDQCKRLP
ncbi:DUF1223 domain-containing protein [Dokdonella soli]|uniref:DUF1223 domain-containing protein n=2 Tax=Dokdonella soli TaxID=529810 RepID=A0ABN1IQF1_9GAMM